MGYCIDVTVKVKIPKEKKAEIFAAFKKLEERSKTYRWVNEGFADLGTVKALFEEWRYDCILSTKGYYLINSFSGEKLGDDEDLWKALAPLVLDGSYVKFSGEDHAQWKYIFKNGKLEEKHGRTVYD